MTVGHKKLAALPATFLARGLSGCCESVLTSVCCKTKLED